MVRGFVSFVAAAVLAAVCTPAIAAAQQPPAARSAASGAKKAPAGIVNINTAPAADLEQLPGIGARTAARIVEYRQKNGPFKKVEELMNVRGVGEKNFLKLKAQITIGQPKAEHSQQQ